MRLPPQPGEPLQRDRSVTFQFEGKPVTGFLGDSIGSALFGAGQRVFSRSFKYHRPRGLLCCRGQCPNCMMTVDGVPNVRVCVEPVREGARVEPQNVWGSLRRDLLAATDKVGGPFTPVGFYYRTMIRPRRAWPLYEKFLRSVAGLGKVDKHGKRSARFDTEHRRAEVLVIGGGRSGLEAAERYADEGRHVVVVESDPLASRAARADSRRFRERRSGSTRGTSCPSTPAVSCTAIAPSGSWSRPARSSSRSSSPGTTSWASCFRRRSAGSSGAGR